MGPNAFQGRAFISKIKFWKMVFDLSCTLLKILPVAWTEEEERNHLSSSDSESQPKFIITDISLSVCNLSGLVLLSLHLQCIISLILILFSILQLSLALPFFPQYCFLFQPYFCPEHLKCLFSIIQVLLLFMDSPLFPPPHSQFHSQLPQHTTARTASKATLWHLDCAGMKLQRFDCMVSDGSYSSIKRDPCCIQSMY